MRGPQITRIANYDQKPDVDKKISEALDTLVALLGIEAGSIKVYVQQGKWSPRIEVQMNVTKEIKQR